MKRISVLIFTMAATLATYAQNNEEYDGQEDQQMKTLMGGSNTVGGYGAISIQYSQIEDRDAFVFGARGGIMMGHMVTLGIGGSGFFNDGQYDSNTGTDISIAGGYGGIFFEPVLMPNMPVHVAFPVMVGAGGIWVMTAHNDDWSDKFRSEASDAYMVIEPGVEVELNVTRFFRFCIGGSYRYTSDVNIEDPDYTVPTDILRGFSGGVTFKFGRF